MSARGDSRVDRVGPRRRRRRRARRRARRPARAPGRSRFAIRSNAARPRLSPRPRYASARWSRLFAVAGAAREVEGVGFYEEAFVEAGVPRPQYRALLNALGGRDLRALERDVVADVAARGVTFGDEDDGSFTVDPVPRVLVGEEWRYLEAGLIQRVRALDAFVTDAYAEQRIVAAGVVPAHVIETASYYEPAMAGARLAGAVAVAGLDVVRDHHGRFLVLEDNVRTPSGIAYAVAARELMDRHLPLAHDGRRRVDDAFAMLGGALRAAAPAGCADPLVVVLTDGPANSAWWE